MPELRKDVLFLMEQAEDCVSAIFAIKSAIALEIDEKDVAELARFARATDYLREAEVAIRAARAELEVKG